MKYYNLLFLMIGSILIVHQNVIAQSAEQQSEQFQNQIIDSIFSKSLNENRDFWVKLPDNYDPNSKEKYAVIYLLDGFSLQSNLEAVYNNYWGRQAVAEGGSRILKLNIQYQRMRFRRYGLERWKTHIYIYTYITIMYIICALLIHTYYIY